MRQSIRIVLASGLAACLVGGVGAGIGPDAGAAWAHGKKQESEPRRATPLLVQTGMVSEIGESGYHNAASQEVFDRLWITHMGGRVEKAAQGWAMTPQIDFDACEAVFLFGGDRINSNGFRVVEMLEEDDAVTIRYESISFQTAGVGGDGGAARARPWAFVLIEKSGRTIFLEENTQNIIGRDPIWTGRAAFPGEIGIGRVVPGTRQWGDR